MNNLPTFPPRACTFALEPRILFDGAAMAAVDDHLVAEQHHFTVETISHQVTEAVTNRAEVQTEQDAPPDAGAAASATLLIVDGRVRDTATLLDDMPANVTAIVVEVGESGFAAAAAALDSLEAVDSIQIISHGTGGGFFLGSDYIDAATVVQYSKQLQLWGASLTDGGDILLYGCHIGAGAEGALLLSQLAGMTGADVAASVDATGAMSLGGNWILEVSTGSIEALPAITASARDSYQYLLAAPVINDTAVETRTVAEDQPLPLSGLSVEDADDDQLTVTFTTADGTLRLGESGGLSNISGDGTDTLSFSGTVADINTALATLTFQGLPDKNGPAEVTMEVSDGESSISRTISIIISPVNDAPTWSGGTGVEVAEGEEVFFQPVDPFPDIGFEQSQLGLREIDNTANQVIFKITSLPGQGTIRLSGTELAVGSTFAASQLGNLSYTHNGSQVLANTGDSFTVIVDDGAGGQLFHQEVSITVTPVNQPPSVIGRVTVIEGEAHVNLAGGGVIPATGSPRGSVTVSDPDDSSDRLSYAVTGLPEHGTLFYGGEPIESADVPFAVDDLTLLTYSHDGSEANGVPDGFDLRVTDSGGGTDTPLSTVERVVIDVINNNDDPVLVTNVPQTMPDGQFSLTITADMLKVEDVDSPPITLTYTVTAAPDPAEGYFTVNGQRLIIGSSFTQADIDAGRVVYYNRASEAHTAELSFTVKDGDRRLYPTPRDGGIYDDGTDTLTVNTFTVEINENSPVFGGDTPGAAVTHSTPSVSGDNAAELFESGSVVLTSADLQASAPATPAGQLVYRLISLPESGTLYLNGTALSYSDSFTQDDVDQGRIRFEHAGDEVFSDSFTYTVSNGVAESSAHVFQLDITPQNDTPVARVGERVFGAEGETVPITQAHIVLTDADRSSPAGGYAVDNVLSFRITEVPGHGGLYLDGTLVTVGTVISAADLSAGRLEYRHDGSENHADAFTLVPIDDQGVGEDDVTATNQPSEGTPLIVPITLTPVNDAPEFAGKQELIGSRAVLEGSTTTIWGAAGYSGPNGEGSADLRTDDTGYLVYQDPDNTTEQRQYRITSAPANGVLMLGGTVLSTGSVFTQDDLDHGLIRYRHNGSETSSDSFSYVVSDGDYSANEDGSSPQGTTADPATFHIEILPANDPPAITVSAARLTVDSAVTWVSLPAITLADPDVGGDMRPGEEDFMQVRVDFRDDGGNPYGVLSFNGGVPANVTVIGAAEGSSLVFQGSLADVQAALDRVQVRLADGSDPDSDGYSIRVSADDRLRNESGELIGGANGGPVNEDGSAVDDTNNVASVTIRVAASSTNDPPVITAPTQVTLLEDTRTRINGLSFVDDDAFDSNTTTVTLTAEREGRIYFSASGSGLPAGVTVVAGAVGSSNVTLRGTTDGLNAALAALHYLGATDYNGDDSLTIEVDDHGNTGQDGGTSTAVATIDIAITPVNDPPTVTMPVGARYLTGSTGVFTFTGGDALGFDDIRDRSHTLPGFEVSSDEYTITLEALDPHSNPYGHIEVTETSGLTVTGLHSGRVTLTGTKADLDAALATVSYRPGDANVNSAITFRMRVDDLGNGGEAIGGSGGSLTATGECTFYVTDTNDPPGFADLDAVSANTYVENGPPVVIDPDAQLTDPELDIYPSWAGAQLTVNRSQGQDSEDVFGFTGSGGTGINQNGTDLRNGTTVIGTVTNTDGRLHITFNSNATANVVDRVLQSITYRNTSEAPPDSVELTFTVNDQNSNADGGTAGSGQDQGSGGSLSFSQNVTVNIEQRIDNPVLSSGSGITYTENNPPQTVDSGLTITDLDDTHMLSAQVAISSGFVSGDVLAVDVTGTGITAVYNEETGVLMLTGVDTVEHYQQVLRSLTYESTSEDPTSDATRTSRTLTYTVQDNGSSGAG